MSAIRLRWLMFAVLTGVIPGCFSGSFSGSLSGSSSRTEGAATPDGPGAPEEMDGEMAVQTYCATCHSLTLVYGQSGNNRFWRDTIDLMRAKNNLSPIPVRHEATIIDYLANRAVERAVVRRAPLEPAFLPAAR